MNSKLHHDIKQENELQNLSNNNRAVKVFGTCLDITERKMAEKNLKAALEHAQESDRLKSAFLTNMSHEIRTPMNGILGFVDLLNTPELSDSKRTEFTNIINMSSGRLLNTINNLIDLSKIEAGQVKISNSMICLNKLFNELYVFFDREVKAKGLSLISSPPENQITIFTDNDKLYGILVNLIKNAIKYTEKGSITFGYNIKNDFIEFFVEDSGIGVPEYKQKAIFDRFVQADIGDTRAFEGSGLGLSIAQAYVEMLGGEIWMKSTEGKGTKFIFTIPAIFGENKKNTSDQEISELLSAKNTFKNTVLLIAEDDTVASSYYQIILQNKFKQIFHAENGKKAVEIYKKNPDIDIILMDIKMPEMDGYEASREIKKLNKDVIIIAQTAYAFKDDREKEFKAVYDDYIVKPIKKDYLIEKLKLHVK